MKTLHVTKDVRDKFCAHAAAITRRKHGKSFSSKDGKKKTSEGWLQLIFEELRTGRYDGSWTKSRIAIKPDGDLELFLRQQISQAMSVPLGLVLFNEAFWYPPGSFHEWKDGSEKPGLHAQFIYASQPDRSCMKTYYDGQYSEYYDSGFDLRSFSITNPNIGEFRFWHCVYSDVDRVVVDFKINLPRQSQPTEQPMILNLS